MLWRTVLITPTCVPTELVSTTFGPVAKSITLGLTLVTKYRTTEVLKTEAGVDPQARWIAIPQPEEVKWTPLVRRKTNHKKSTHGPPSLAVEPTARATAYHRSSGISKSVPMSSHFGSCRVSNRSNIRTYTPVSSHCGVCLVRPFSKNWTSDPLSTYCGVRPGASDSKTWTSHPVSSCHDGSLTRSGSDKWTTDPVSTHRGVCLVGSKGNNWTVDLVDIHCGKTTVRFGSSNWTTDEVSTHCGVCPGESESNNWTIDPVGIHRGKTTVRSVSNTRTWPSVSDKSLRSYYVGNHCCHSTVSHIGRCQVKDCVCNMPDYTSLGSIPCLLG